MSSVEDRTRAAMDAITAQVDGAPPLPLPPPRAPGAARRPRGAPAPHRRWRSWLAPAAAAAAVIALAISLVIIRDIPNGPAVPPARPAPASGVPRYYAALVPQAKLTTSQELVVGDTLTGTRLATLTPPRGSTFIAVAAAADDRTFVVAAQPILNPEHPTPDTVFPARTWYLLRIAPGTSSPARLTRLPIPGLEGAGLFALALSGSGRELAVGFIPGYAISQSSPVQLRIYSVTTGKLERAWSTRDHTVFGANQALTTALTWVDNDRALAFSTASLASGPGKYEDTTHMTLRLLDLAAAGSGDLVADSRVIWSAESTNSSLTGYGQLSCANTLDNPMLTADGKTIVCVAFKSPTTPGSVTAPGRWTLAWLAYSVSAPTVAHTVAELSIDASRSSPPQVGLLWASPSGGTVIGVWSGGTWAGPAPPPGDRWGATIVSDGEFRALPTPPALTSPEIAW